MSKYLGGCDAAKRDLGLEYCSCCDSCHEDWEFVFEDGTPGNYYPSELCVADGWYEVCCGVINAYKLRTNNGQR